MRYLLILDFTLAAFGAAMTIGVGFVAAVYLIYGHTSPRMEAALPGILVITGCFVALCVLGLLAAVLLRRQKALHWAAQLILFGSLPLLWQTVLARITN